MDQTKQIIQLKSLVTKTVLKMAYFAQTPKNIYLKYSCKQSLRSEKDRSIQSEHLSEAKLMPNKKGENEGEKKKRKQHINAAPKY